MKILVLVLFLMNVAQAAAAKNVVAKVKEISGKVLTQGASGKTKTLSLNDSVSEGDIVQTQEKSAVTLEYADQSIVTVSGGSKMSIEAKVEGAPMLQLARGNLRIKVAKGMSEKPKFLLKTKSATMGVRGTDFQAIYNEGNKVTSVVTFEGNVAMAKSLGQLSDSANSVSVKPGTFSIVSPSQPQPSIPTKISPAQFNTLRTNNPMKTSAPQIATSKEASTFSPVPPGIDPKTVMIADAASVAGVRDTSLPPPEGYVDGARVAPPAGGFIDLQTALYVAPPPGSAFDPAQQVYIPPASFGTVNEATGAYQAPQGVRLSEAGTFVAVTSAGAASSSASASSNPAPNSPAPNSQPAGAALGTLFVGAPVGANQNGFMMTQAPPPPGVTPQMATQMQLPGAGAQLASAMNMPVGSINYGAAGSAYFDTVSGQPLFPTYYPGACAVSCSPLSQPGTSNAGSGGTGSDNTPETATAGTSTIVFTVN